MVLLTYHCHIIYDKSHCLKEIPKKIELEDAYITNILNYMKKYGNELSTIHVDLMNDYYV